jgi:HTH-type transcriptional regulator, sugar sensing transcriptional regulator
MLLEQYLQNIGLEAKEAKVYLAGLQLGPTTIVELSKASNIKRSTVYEVIESLKEKNMINISQKGKRKIFSAQDPDNLLLYLKQKENVLSQIMPDLEALKNTSAKKPAIRIFEGQKGLEQIYEDMIKKPGELLILAAPREKISKGLLDFLNEWRYRRYKARVPVRRVNVNETGDDNNDNQKVEKPEKMEVIKYLPINNYPFSVGTYIYRNKVAFISYAEQEMVGVVIRSPELNNTMKLVFEFFWK